MAANRLTRDQIINRALDMVDSAALNQKERPGGALHQNAMSISWLQDGLDLFHRAFPWTGTVTTSVISFSPSTNTYALPTDFTMDVRNGIRIMQTNTKRRLHRKPLNWLLKQDTTSACNGVPWGYVILTPNIKVWPWPNNTYTGELWYYALPSELAAGQKPNFPDDWSLVEYVRLRGKEWTNEAEPSTAITYARGLIGQLMRSGLGIEADIDELELDDATFTRTGADGGHPSDWMGNSLNLS